MILALMPKLALILELRLAWMLTLAHSTDAGIDVEIGTDNVVDASAGIDIYIGVDY